MFVPKVGEKTVRIWVRVKEDGLVTFDRKPIPKIKAGTIGDLIVPAASILDAAERAALEAESVVRLLRGGTSVFVSLSPERVEVDRRCELLKPSDLGISPGMAGTGYCFAEVTLREELKLRVRGNKEPCLEPCKCFIRVLGKEAVSLNHAFTLLSTGFETKRLSHSGNAFSRVYCFSEDHKSWYPLNELRGHIEHLLPT